MRDLWYGDRRDLVKWATLVGLAQKFQMRHVLQVLYYRSNAWESIDIDGAKFEIPPSVIAHFRDVGKVCGMECQLTIEIVREPFKHARREEYFQTIKTAIAKRNASPGIVFLDPDTGLEPPSGRSVGNGHRCKARSEHVCEIELANLWELLSKGDTLVLYQHRIREKSWREGKLRQFTEALGLHDSVSDSIGIAFADQIANDVAFYFVQRRS